jgi:serine/threonine protein kinase
MDYSIGQSFGDYEILGTLGAGGMGKVYKVRNKISDRVEAMKILLADLCGEPELVQRFTREIRIFGSLNHPNITELRTALRVDNILAMIMEYVEGSSLDALMKQGRIPLDQALDCMCQALSALSYAHSQGVVHRDIKPANMMLMPNGTLKLMDFGIAKAVSDPKLTRSGFVVGSVYYIPPEQVEGKDIDARSDLYSLGVTLYELVTGKRPFDGTTDYEIISAHLKQTPSQPRELDPTLPPELNDIIMLALQKNPDNRFQSADAFRNALSSVLATLRPTAATAAAPVATVPPITPSPADSAKRNNRLIYMLLGSAATIAVIVGAAIEGPKLLHTSAAVKVDTPKPDPAAVPAPVNPAPIPESTPVPAPTSTPATPPAAQPEATPAPVSSPVVVKTPAKPAPPTPVAKAQPHPQVPAVQQPIQTQPPVQAQTPVQPPPVAQQPPPRPVNNAALDQVREHANMISIRVSTIRAAFQNFQRQQAAQGLSPRSDMVGADQRLGYQLDQAEAAMQSGDAEGARKRLDAAERDLERLEKFLGK